MRMQTSARVFVMLIAGWFVVGAAPAGTVQIYADGKLRGAFQPRGEPWATDGPSVSLYLEMQDVKTADGRPVAGFAFIGWPEGQGVRVQVLLLLPAKGEASSYVPEVRRSGLHVTTSPARYWREATRCY